MLTHMIFFLVIKNRLDGDELEYVVVRRTVYMLVDIH
jgi:hypothetical protein